MTTWRHYLHGNPFTLRVLTDHHSLQWLKTQPHLSLRQTRWVEKLAEFDYNIEYQEGKKNVVADALSRRPDHRPTDMHQPHLTLPISPNRSTYHPAPYFSDSKLRTSTIHFVNPSSTNH